MEKIKLNIFLKSKLLNIPENIFSIKKDVETYKEVIYAFLNHKKGKKIGIYEISKIFDYFIKEDNHIILYHSKNKSTSLLMIKYNSKYFFHKIPYVNINSKLEKLEKTNFIAYYK